VSHPGGKAESADRAQALKAELERRTGNNFQVCYQCGKCTAGCPLAEVMETAPSALMRLIQLGDIEAALKSQTLWCCAGCQTCTSRCPQGLDPAGTLDALREMAVREKMVSPDQARRLAHAFHRAFLDQVRKGGRLNEIGLVTAYKMRTGKFVQDMDKGALMMLQGKIHPTAVVTGGERVKARDQIERIFAEAERTAAETHAPRRRPTKQEYTVRPPIKIDPGKPIGYYPGCSLGGTAVEFGISTRRMCERLGVELRELDDWNCCGASSAHALNHRLAELLPARNQALADAQGYDVVLTPCAACYNRQVLTRSLVRGRENLRKTIREITGLEVSGRAQFINGMELLEGLGLDYVRKKVVRPLAGMKVACYYGCLLVRPLLPEVFDDPEHPTKMDEIVRALGAEPVEWDFKVECCGAGLTMAQPKWIEELTHRIVRNAHQAGAAAFVVACPLCHSNLDMRQAAMRKRFGDVPVMPVYYLSELAAIACGASPKDVAVGKHFVPATALVGG